jgi:putative N6-adenine-specific DNA methylase
VRVRLKSFIARDFEALLAGLGRLPFSAFLARGGCAEVRVVSHRSRLWHSGAVKERVEQLLSARSGVSAGHAEEGAVGVYVRLTGDAVQVSVDAGGYRLHRRGYRAHTAEASLRETLAAVAVGAAVDGSGQSPAVLWDPFAGAGTLGLEALLRARGTLAGGGRNFAFQSWPTHDATGFAALHAELTLSERAAAPHRGLRVVLSDHSGSALSAARSNAERAGVEDGCEFLLGDVVALAEQIPRGAGVVSNPPYGRRLEEGGAIRALLQALKLRPDLRPCVLLVGGEARDLLPPTFRTVLRTKNGGTSVSLKILDGGSVH